MFCESILTSVVSPRLRYIEEVASKLKFLVVERNPRAFKVEVKVLAPKISLCVVLVVTNCEVSGDGPGGPGGPEGPDTVEGDPEGPGGPGTIDGAPVGPIGPLGPLGPVGPVGPVGPAIPVGPEGPGTVD